MEGQWNAESPVRAVNGALAVGKITNVSFSEMQHCWIPAPWTPGPLRPPYCEPRVQPVRVVSETVIHRPTTSKIESAFKVVKRLIETGVIGEMTVKQFTAAVEDVEKVL